MAKSPSNSDFARGLGAIENRIDQHEALQKTVALRIDELERSFADRIAAKDGIIELVKDATKTVERQNDNILKQLGFRFNFITGMTSFVALAFVLNFGYEIIRIKDVMEAREFLREGGELLAENSTRYSDILSRLTRADTFLSQGHREFQRTAYFASQDLANAAIVALEPALETTGSAAADIRGRSKYDRMKCSVAGPNPSAARINSIKPIRSEKVERAFAHLRPENLRPAVIDTLFEGYDLRNRANFFWSGAIKDSRTRGMMKGMIKEDGMFLLALDGARWEGYHWVGLAAAEDADYDDAISCFTNSVNQKGIANKDYINLAELLFLKGKYDEARRQAEAYLKPLGYAFLSSTDVVAHFYLTLANFLSRDARQSPILTPREFRRKLRENEKKISLEGTFSQTELDDFRKGKLGSLTPQQESEVKSMIECLTERICLD